jgi:hypothetical protein
MDHQFKEDHKTVPTLKNSSMSQEKISPVPTLFITSLSEDEQRLTMGEEVGTM